jgi:uncharacterized membrane protein YkgB
MTPVRDGSEMQSQWVLDQPAELRRQLRGREPRSTRRLVRHRKLFAGVQRRAQPRLRTLREFSARARPWRLAPGQRAENQARSQPLNRFDLLEQSLQTWLAAHSITITRVAVGIIFFWFGVLKFFPGLSVAEDLAGRTIATLTHGIVAPKVAVPVLAAWESAIGLGLLTHKFMRATLVLLALQLSGTFTPLLFFPSEIWTHMPYAPTLEGQYVIKNLALVAAGLLLAATVRGGRVIADPWAAQNAARQETIYRRFRRRFRVEP